MKPAEPLHPHEWSFDGVPIPELPTCCYWEYARESQTIQWHQDWHFWESRRRLQRYDYSKRALVKNTSTEIRMAKLALRELAEIFDNEKFLERLYNSDCGYSTFFEHLLQFSGPDARSWQELPEQLRGYIRSSVDETFYPSIQPALVGELETLWEGCSKKLQAERAKLSDDTDFEAFQPTQPIVGPPGHGGEKHGPTIAAFAVDFVRYNDEEIAIAFAAWLAENRPKDCLKPAHRPEPSDPGNKLRAGHKLVDWKKKLRDLGVMRLMNFCTVAAMPSRCSEAARTFQHWESKHWSAARKRALRNFRAFFPFLPKGELPLHARTKGGRAKL